MKRIISFLLAGILVISLCPTAFAKQSSPASLKIFSQTSSTLAPGVTQDIVYAKSVDTGEQLKYYVATADTTRDDVTLNATYKDAQWAEWGLQTIPEQMAAGEKAHSDPSSDRYIANYTAIAGVNGAYYNMSTGQPQGAFAMEGHIIQDSGSYPFFAILKDGTPVIGFNSTDWNTYKNNAENPIWEAVAGHSVQVRDGQKVAGNDTNLYPRVSVGLTADNKVVLVTADGWNAPTSVGASLPQMADILLANGCVNGLELDGGGSATYVARQEGENSLSVVNRPSDSYPRATSNGLMIVSTTPPSDVFERAVLTPAHDYATPGSAVAVDAVGVSPAGTSAEIPADVSWQLADPALGSVEAGTFTSNGTVGDAVIQMTYEGRVVGETTVHVVVPDSLTFSLNTYTVPYGTSTDLVVRAYCGLNEVPCKDGDITLALSDPAAGVVNGLTFTACEMSPAAPTEATVTASFAGADASVTATATVRMGQGSRVLYDFEDGTKPSDLSWGASQAHAKYNIFAPASGIVTAETGRVHSGNYALALCADWSNICDFGGCTTIQLDYKGETPIDLTDAVGIGAWIWIPDEYKETNIRFVTRGQSDVVNTNFSRPLYGTFEEGGHWTYVYQQLSGESGAYVNSAFIQFELYASARMNENEKSAANIFTYYVDDITVDYSSAILDRTNPVFDSVNLHPNTETSVPMAKGAVADCASGSVAFSASVSDADTGINPSSAAATVDGQPISVTCTGSTLRTEEVKLAAGPHVLKLTIADNTGNSVSVIRRFRVSANADIPTVRVVPHDAAANNLLIGSVYYVDVIASDVSAIDGVEMKLDLNNISTWELAYADVDASFEMAYSVEDLLKGDNIATVTLKRKSTAGAEDRTGEAVLASLPIRTWVGDEKAMSNSSARQWPRDITVEVDFGKVTYAAGYGNDVFPGFSSEQIQVDTQLNTWKGSTDPHTHTLGEATDKAATCVASGYTGRVFCDECKSPVEWGTVIPASDHGYAVNEDGKLACTGCGKLYNGVYEGLTYVDGVVIADGWTEENLYYKDGEKLTGVQLVDGKYHDFGEDGVCTDRENGYTGFFEQDSTQHYAEFGTLKTGWFSVLEDRYHADENGVLHTVTTYDEREGSCTKAGRIIYTCSCGEEEQTDRFWSTGHTWDANHVCTKCGTVGIDISTANLNIHGTYFSYTGAEIRPDHDVTYTRPDGTVRTLIIASDRFGEDGYSTYNNNREIGTGTVTVMGQGDFYGEVKKTFVIVPADVTTLTATRTGDDSVTISWPQALAADYYALYCKAKGDAWDTSDATQVVNGNIQGTSYTLTGLEPGEYVFRAASRAVRDGTVYNCARWSEELEVIISAPMQITVAEVKNGSASTSPEGTVLPGEVVTVTTVPDPGYQTRAVSVKDAENTAVEVTRTADNQYTFVMPASAVTITPSFSAQGDCAYLTGDGAGPYQAQLVLSNLLNGRTYVCQMQKADANGNEIGCAAIAVFTAAGDTQRLDVLPSPGGYLVSLFAYPESGFISNIGDLSVAFLGQHVTANDAAAASMLAMDAYISVYGEYVDESDIAAIPGAGQTDADAAIPDGVTAYSDETGSDAPGLHGTCAYLAGSGPFTAQLQLAGLLPGRTYVCQMEKANTSGTSIGCAAIVVFTAESDTQLLDVLPNPNGGYIVSLFTYPGSGTITDISQLSPAILNSHASS